MKICFCTYVNDKYYHSMGADKLVASLKYFHPSIPILVYGDEDIKEFDVPFGLLHPFMIYKALLEYETVIYIDADSMIAGPLDELLLAVENYDIVGVRNNNDQYRAGKDEPIGQPGSGTADYLNAGLIATHHRGFILEWQMANILYGNLLPFKEQSVFNSLKRNYNTHMIDPKDSKVYYGVSALSGTETHWDSWMDIKVVEGDLILNDKKVKVLHHGGGTNPNKLGFYMFNDETRKRLIEIVGM